VRLMLAFALLAAASIGLGSPSAIRAEEDEKEKPLVVEEGRTISIEYTLKLDDGSTADSNVGEDPLRYVQGEGQILPSLENALAGLGVAESKEVTLTPDEGYGEVDPARRQTVDPQDIPEEAREVGTQLIASDAAGNRMPVRVHEVRADAIVLDLNHPLAGRTLHFSVKVVEIQ
jgi:FKBP-type peptidyl-prolyl cis-trans isomerase SlyD